VSEDAWSNPAADELSNEVPGHDLVGHAGLEVPTRHDEAQPARVDQQRLRSLGDNNADVGNLGGELVGPAARFVINMGSVGLFDQECDMIRQSEA
jgi:hypothetical protein